MPTLTIRKLDDELKTKLRIRAARHGRSMEEEARLILRESLNAVAPAEPARHWVDEVQALFAPHGGLPDLQPPPFDTPRNPFAKPARRQPRKRAGA
jgi:plasmid stability protein